MPKRSDHKQWKKGLPLKPDYPPVLGSSLTPEEIKREKIKKARLKRYLKHKRG